MIPDLAFNVSLPVNLIYGIARSCLLKCHFCVNLMDVGHLLGAIAHFERPKESCASGFDFAGIAFTS